MDVTQFIQDNGLQSVSNPKYNKKSKVGRQQPPTISAFTGFQTPSQAVNLAQADALNSYSVGKDIADKYVNMGLNYNRREAASENPMINLDNQLSDRQGFWSRLWNAGKQAVVSDLLLGTVKGFSDIIGGLAAIPSEIANYGEGTGNDYSNIVSDWIERQQQTFEENNPIYTRTDDGMFSVNTILSHIPSVAAIASMVIPSTGFVKGISLLGKASGLGKATTFARLRAAKVLGAYERGADGERTLKALGNMNWAARNLTDVNRVRQANAAFQTTVGGIVNTAMWNYAEAHGVYNQMYQESSDAFKNMSDEDYQKVIERSKTLLYDKNGNPTVDLNNRDAVARRIASASADRAFGFDWYNAAFMIPQYWGLRNMAESVKRGPITAALRKQQREDILRAQAIAEGKEAEHYIKNMSTWNRVKAWGSDNAPGAWRVAKSQFLGGAQMALVGFGRKEGIYYGESLLNKTPASSFDDRLQRYIEDPTTFEDTLWGMIAGTAFHMIGGKVKSIGTRIETAHERNKAENNQETETGRSRIKELFAGETVDNKRRKTAMTKRDADFQTLVRNMDDIVNKGKNPFVDRNEDGELVDYDKNNEEVKNALIRQARDTYITNRTLDSADYGTLHLEREYMASDAVRKAMAKSLKLSDSEATEWQQHILDTMDKVEKEYDNQLAHATQGIDEINKSHRRWIKSLYTKGYAEEDGLKHAHDEIPIQYASAIARHNTKLKMSIVENNDYLTHLTQSINARLQNAGDKIPNVDYQAFYDAFDKANRLGNLYAEKKRLKALHSKDAGVVYSLGRINRQIEALETDIRRDGMPKPPVEENGAVAFDAMSAARTFFIFNYGRSAEYDNNSNSKTNGHVVINEREFSDRGRMFDFTTTDERIVADLPKIAEFIGIDDVNYLDSTQTREAIHKYIDQWKAFQKEGGKYNLDEHDSALADDMKTVAAIKSLNTIYNNEIRYTKEELRSEALAMDNVYNIAKRDTIQKAIDTIVNVHTAHLKDGATKIDMFDIIDKFEDNSDISKIEGLSDSEIEQLYDAFSILDLTAVGNHEISMGLRDALNAATIQKILKDKQDAEDGKDTNTSQENTTTNQNGSQSTQNQQPINSTQGGQQSQGTQATQPQDTSGQSQTPTQPTNQGQGNGNENDTGSNTSTGHKAITVTIGDVNTSIGGTKYYTTARNADDAQKLSRFGNTHTVRLVETDEDGVYELVGDGQELDAGVVHDDNLYSITGDSDDAPGFPIKNPLVKFDDHGRLIVVEPGVVDRLQNGQIRSDIDEQYQGTKEEQTENPADDINNQRADGQGEQPAKPNNTGQGNGTLDGRGERGGDQIEEGKQTQSSSTGEHSGYVPKPGDEINPETGELISRGETNDIIGNLTASAREAFKNKTPWDIDKIRQQYKNTYVRGSDFAAENAQTIEETISALSDLYGAAGMETIDSGAKLVADVVMSESAIEDIPIKKGSKQRKRQIRKDTADKIDKLIDKFVDVTESVNVDGKKYISLEQLLRYCIEQNKGNKNTAKVIYSKLVTYLSSTEGKNKYVVDDMADTNNYVVLGRAMQTAQERMRTIAAEDRTNRINTVDFIQALKDNGSPEYQKAFDEASKMQVGDKLDFEVTPNGRVIFKRNGTAIADVPVPTVMTSNGAYRMINKGVVTDVRVDVNNNVHSALYDRFVKWINGSTNDATLKELTDILTAYRSADAKQKATLYQKFLANAEVNDARKNGLFEINDNNLIDQKSLEHLSNIWNYTSYAPGTNANDIRINRLWSVRNWFLRLNDTYSSILSLKANPDLYSVTVSRVTDGELITDRTTRDDDRTDTKYKSMTPISEALGSLVKGKTFLGTVADKFGGAIDMSNGERIIAGGIARGGNFLMIPNRNGHYEWVHAYGQRINEESLSGQGKEIVDALHSVVNDCIAQLLKDKGYSRKEAFDKLESTLRSLFQNKHTQRDGTGSRVFYGQGSNLFKGIVIDDVRDEKNNKTGFVIYVDNSSVYNKFKDPTDRTKGQNIRIQFSLGEPTGQARTINGHAQITISDFRAKDANGKTIVKDYEYYQKSNSSKMNYVSDAELQKAGDAINAILDEFASFNLGFNNVRSDSTNRVVLDGATKRDPKTNEFIVKIGDKEWRSKSFNDFITDNNLIRVNTSTPDGVTNFKPIGQNQRANQTVQIKIDRSTPVKKEGGKSRPTKAELRTKAEDILAKHGEDDNFNTGRELAELVLANRTVKRMSGDITDDLGNLTSVFDIILPKNIKFVANINDTKEQEPVTAFTNTTGKDATLTYHLKSDDSPIKVDIKNGQVIVGEKFMKALLNPKTKNRAIRTLMHERLHQVLHTNGNEKYIQSIREIYDAFVEANKSLDDSELSKHIRAYEFGAEQRGGRYRKEDGTITDEGLEEFLVYSLTSNDLANRLNEIQATKELNGDGKDTLLSKIMQLVSKIFDDFVGIKSGSLREQEFETLRRVLDDSSERTEESKTERDETKTEEPKGNTDNSEIGKEGEKIDETTPPANNEEENSNQGNGDSEPITDVPDGFSFDFHVGGNDSKTSDDFGGNPDNDRFDINGFNESTIEDRLSEIARDGRTVKENFSISDYGTDKQNLSFEEKSVYDKLLESGALSIVCG